MSTTQMEPRTFEDFSEVPDGHGTLHITDASGDTRIMWDPTQKDEKKAAKAAFDEALRRGMLAYMVDPTSGEKTGSVIREFPDTAGKVIMVRQLQGG